MFVSRLISRRGMPSRRRPRERQMTSQASWRSTRRRWRSSFRFFFCSSDMRRLYWRVADSGWAHPLPANCHPLRSMDRNLLSIPADHCVGVTEMTLVNSLCAEISIFEGVGEPTGVVVERSAIRGEKGLCKSMRDLAIKSRVLGDGYYYLPLELWP